MLNSLPSFHLTSLWDSILSLLTERRVSSGQIRVLDGQTLVLSGIIRDSEQTTVHKVPL